MLRTAIPVVAVMLALLTGVGTKAPDRPFPIYPRPGGPPRAAAAMVERELAPGPAAGVDHGRARVALQVYLNP